MSTCSLLLLFGTRGLTILGGSATAAGELVKKIGANVVGYVFLDELEFLKGRDKLDAPVHTLLLRDMDLVKMEQEARDKLQKLGRMNKQ